MYTPNLLNYIFWTGKFSILAKTLVRRVHIWSSGCRPCQLLMLIEKVNVTKSVMNSVEVDLYILIVCGEIFFLKTNKFVFDYLMCILYLLRKGTKLNSFSKRIQSHCLTL